VYGSVWGVGCAPRAGWCGRLLQLCGHRSAGAFGQHSHGHRRGDLTAGGVPTAAAGQPGQAEEGGEHRHPPGALGDGCLCERCRVSAAQARGGTTLRLTPMRPCARPSSFRADTAQYADPNFIKLFQLAQLMIEYCLYSQEVIDEARLNLQKVSTAARAGAEPQNPRVPRHLVVTMRCICAPHPRRSTRRRRPKRTS
jgi:hypothetical protein